MFEGISPHCNIGHFVCRNGPFQRLKSTISHPKMGLNAPRNGLYQKAERTFPDYVMGYIKTGYCPKHHLSYTI